MGYEDLMKVVEWGKWRISSNAKMAEVVSSQDAKASLKLANIDFDKASGFVWNGEFEAGVKDYIYTRGNNPCRGISVRNTPKRDGYFYDCFHITIKKGKKASVKYRMPMNTDRVIQQDSEAIKCQRSVESGCYQDLQPLLEDYFWDYLRVQYKNIVSDGNIVHMIADLELEQAVSSYLQGLIAAYSDSYIRNIGVLGGLYVYSSQQRYGICINDENFKRAVDTQKHLLEMRFDDLGFLARDFMEDKEKYFLYKVDSLQKDFPRILWEFGWRLAPLKTSSGTRLKASYPKRLEKKFEQLYERLKDGLITKEEKERIKTLEKAMFAGDKTARADYDLLVGEIKNRYQLDLDEIQCLYDDFSYYNMDDSSMDKYKGYRNEPGLAIQYWLLGARKNFKNLRNGQGGSSPETVYNTKKQTVELVIDYLLSDSTYVDKDGRQREMTLLDRRRQAVLDKAESIEAGTDAKLKKKQYELFAEDVKALREIQYIIGVARGNKATLLYELEDTQRNALFGENLQYLTADRFFAKIEEMSAPQTNGYGTKERSNSKIQLSYMMEDIGRKLSGDDAKRNLEKVLGKMNGTVVDGGLGKLLFGGKAAEEIFCSENGDIDIRKLAEARKSILHALEEIWDVPANERKVSGKVKYTLDSALIQAAKNDDDMRNSLCEKLLVIEDQVLCDKPAGGTAYRESDLSGSGPFGEVSDFLSTDAYLEKIYAKINGGEVGSPKPESFENPGYSDEENAGETGLFGKIGGLFRKKM